MEISSAFETLAEISAGLLGFSAVAFALARGPESLEPEDRVRLWLLLTLSVVGILGGILPHVLLEARIEPPALWRWWSWAYVWAAVQVYAGAIVAYRRMDPERRRDFHGRTRVVRSLVGSQNVILGAVLISQLLNAVGFVFHAEAWVCLGALLLTVVQAAIMLLTIIFLRPAWE